MLVCGLHNGCAHVVVEYADFAVFTSVLDADAMPNAYPPLYAFGGFFGNIGARCAVHQKNVVGIGVGFGGNVDIIEVTRVLRIKEEAGVPMCAVQNIGGFHIYFKDEIAYFQIFTQGNGMGRTHFRLVLAHALEQFQEMFAVFLAFTPRFGIAELEFVENVLRGKSLLVYERIAVGDVFAKGR